MTARRCRTSNGSYSRFLGPKARFATRMIFSCPIFVQAPPSSIDVEVRQFASALGFRRRRDVAHEGGGRGDLVEDRIDDRCHSQLVHGVVIDLETLVQLQFLAELGQRALQRILNDGAASLGGAVALPLPKDLHGPPIAPRSPGLVAPR